MIIRQIPPKIPNQDTKGKQNKAQIGDNNNNNNRLKTTKADD